MMFNNLEIADLRNKNLSMLIQSNRDIDIAESITNARQKMKNQEATRRLKLAPLSGATIPTKSIDSKERLILAINDFEDDTNLSFEQDSGHHTTMNFQSVKINPYTAETLKGRRKTLKPLQRPMHSYQTIAPSKRSYKINIKDE